MASNKNAEKYLSNDIFLKLENQKLETQWRKKREKKKRGVNLQEGRQW